MVVLGVESCFWFVWFCVLLILFFVIIKSHIYIYRDSCLSNNFKQLQPAGLGAWVVPSGFVWMICLKVLVNRT